MLGVSGLEKWGGHTIIRQKEANGNYSFVGLSKNVFDEKSQMDFYDYLEKMDFYGGVTSFGEIPRQQAWFYDGGGNFGDRAKWTDLQNPRWIARTYNPVLRHIQNRLQTWYAATFSDKMIGPGINTQAVFDSILLNKYRGWGDSIKPHRDSETIFGDNPTVLILSIGCPREIIFQRILYDKDNLNSIKRDRDFKQGEQSIRVNLPSGSVLLMGGEVQKYYSHEIKKVVGSSNKDAGDNVRYSLTFRQYSR